MNVLAESRGMTAKRRVEMTGTPLRKVIGEIIKTLVPYMGMTEAELARKPGMSPSTLKRVTSGDEAVTKQTLIKVAGAMELHPETFVLVLEGDVARLRTLPLRETVRGFILEAMERADLPHVRRANGG